MINTLRTIVRSVRKFIHLHLRVDVYIVEGNERESGEKLSILFGGRRRNLDYITNFVFSSPPTVCEIDNLWIWNAIGLRKQDNYSGFLTIIDMHKNIYKLFALNNDIFIPHWVGGEVDIQEALDRTKTVKRINKSIKKDLRLIRKNKLTYKVVKGREDFKRFFQDMYTPYMNTVFAERAFLMSHKEMMNKVDHCELLLVEKDGQEIAGSIILYEQGRVRSWSTGVKDGNREHVKAGASAASYYFELLYLSEKGVDKLHFGGSRPFLKDGVLQFKKKWGMSLAGSTCTGFVVMQNESTLGMHAFWKNNPFIFCRKNKLEGAVFINRDDGVSEELLSSLKKQYFFEGMAKLNVLLIGKTQEVISVPRQIPENVTVISKGRLL